MTEHADTFMNRHGRAIVHALLSDFAAIAPRSALPNLIDLLSLIVLKRTDEARSWMKDILFSVRCSCIFLKRSPFHVLTLGLFRAMSGYSRRERKILKAGHKVGDLLCYILTERLFLHIF